MLFDPATTPNEIAAAAYEAHSAGREFMAAWSDHPRYSWPVVSAEMYRDTAETAFEDVIANIRPRPAD